MLHDPVCGRRINRNHAYARITHERVIYFLCCPVCQAEFAAAPERYADPKIGEPVRGPRDARPHHQQEAPVEPDDEGETPSEGGRVRPRRRAPR